MASAVPKLSRAAGWVALEAIGGSAFSSVGLVVIASLIGPRELGVCAIVMGLVHTVNFFPDTLFHDAIIQRRRLSAGHLGSAFWSVCALAAVLGAGVALAAPWVARLYGEPEITPLMLVLSATSLPVAVASIQTARLRRAMRFKPLALCVVTSRAVAMAGGLALALAGAGAWAIIAQYGVSMTVLAALLAVNTRWRFVRLFSFTQARDIGVFAFTRTLSHFVDFSRGQVFFALLGQYLPLDVLGQVNLAFRLVDSTTSMIYSTLLRLYLPVFSRVQTDRSAIEAAVGRGCNVSGTLLIPLFAGLAFTGGDLVAAFATPSWQDMRGLFPWFCAAGVATITAIPSNTAILAVGRPALISAESIVVLAGLVTGILAIAPSTGEQAALCWTLPTLLGLLISMTVARFAIGFTARDQVLSRIPAVAVSIGVVLAAELAHGALGHQAPLLRAAAEIAAGGAIYLLATGTFLALQGSLPLRGNASRLGGLIRVSR